MNKMQILLLVSGIAGIVLLLSSTVMFAGLVFAESFLESKALRLASSVVTAVFTLGYVALGQKYANSVVKYSALLAVVSEFAYLVPIFPATSIITLAFFALGIALFTLRNALARTASVMLLLATTMLAVLSFLGPWWFSTPFVVLSTLSASFSAVWVVVSTVLFFKEARKPLRQR